MLPLPELTQSDYRLPFAGSTTKQGAQGKEGTELPVRGFAEMLTAAVPPKESVATRSGEWLPASGKELPLREADTTLELPTPSLDSASSTALDSVVQALPEAPSELLQGGLPRIETGVNPKASADPVALEPATEASTDTELAALQRMLPTLNPNTEMVTEAAAAAPATDPAQVVSVPFAAPRTVLAGNNAVAATATRSGSNARAYTALPGLVTGETAVATVNGQASAAQPPLPSLPAEPAPLLRDAQNPVLSPTPAATVDVAAGPGKEFAELLAGGKEIRLEAQDTLPRIQPMAAAPLAGPSSTAPALPAAAAALNLPVTDARWGEALGERVTWMAGQKLDSAEIRLNPAELGPIRIKISMEENQAQVTFTAQHAVTRDAIEQALPRLRELFSGEGLNLTNADVNGDGVRHDRGESGRDDDRLGGHDSLLGDTEEDEASIVPTVSTSNGLVDTFV